MHNTESLFLRSEQARRFDHRYVDRVRALAAAEDQHIQTLTTCLLLKAGEVTAHRVARHHAALAEILDRIFKRQRRGANITSEHAVRESRHRVRLDNHRRDATQRRHQQCRPR